jgi:hypothetical protein
VLTDTDIAADDQFDVVLAADNAFLLYWRTPTYPGAPRDRRKASGRGNLAPSFRVDRPRPSTRGTRRLPAESRIFRHRWLMPGESGFYQPVVLARRQAV